MEGCDCPCRVGASARDGQELISGAECETRCTPDPASERVGDPGTCRSSLAMAERCVSLPCLVPPARVV
ncbi:hypothetical protein NDU88_009404 [Pleurodeles waltl]|uniref:Uncharacterized protein n=1 Tax=Pleurodeles waltl TaxID=8319 RepID=A0AAV7RYB0_PLEWA|nr:hypothetical protein NDU88_009395 [Pleurodeles waltl]KAJ1156686.1 hypothetical protein NDU88_009404 [Pleurodeles waltl]